MLLVLPRMNIPSSFDRETLQQFLANAFAVQESRINTQSLSDIMQVQRAVASGKLTLDGAMRHVVESARNVADATGVAIALVEGDHLTYRAGSGSSAVCVGWRVTASLTVAADTRTNREILRVENAQTDRRIEADICRQFGANSLLMLPIYLDGAVAGVLDILFSEPHVFQDREVSTYRLLAEQIEAALFQAPQPEHEENLAPELPPTPEAFDQIAPADENLVLPDESLVLPDENCGPLADENFVPPPDFRMLPQNEHPLYIRCRAVLADVMHLPIFKQLAWIATMLPQRAKNMRRTRPRHSLVRPLAGKLSSAFRRSALIATTLTQRAKNPIWPTRWPSTSVVAARKLSSTLRRSALRASLLTRRAQNLSWPTRLRNSVLAAGRELSSVSGRSVLRATRLAQRAKNLSWFNQRRRLALETVAIVLAFAVLIVFRGRGPAVSLESSTQSNSSAIDQPARPPKPLPGKSASAAPGGFLAPSTKESRHAGTALKRVQVGRNEVDYVADDVTMRVFTNRPVVKRSLPRNSRVAQFGDDVTVRYFAPSSQSTRTASR